LRAVESRVLNYEIKLDYRTKIKVLMELSKKEYKDLTRKDRKEVVSWIRENTSRATKNLNLRILFLLYEMYRFDKQNWVRMAKKILLVDEELKLIVEGVSVGEWCEVTGKSRRTYFRYKKSAKVP
jgi:hypothetical protein